MKFPSSTIMPNNRKEQSSKTPYQCPLSVETLREYALAVEIDDDSEVDNKIDGDTEWHLCECPNCRKRLVAVLFDVGSRTIWEQTANKARDAIAIHELKINIKDFSRIVTKPMVPQIDRKIGMPVFPKEFKRSIRIRDYTGIIRDITDIGRMFNVNFSMMSAQIVDDQQSSHPIAQVEFIAIGSIENIGELQREFMGQLARINQRAEAETTRYLSVDKELEKTIIFHGFDVPDAVIDLLNIVSIRYRTKMSRFGASVKGNGTLEVVCTVIPDTDHHYSQLLKKLRKWAPARGWHVQIS